MEWDETKRLANLAKHGVDFRLAAGVFFGPAIEVDDNRSDYGEARRIAPGKVRMQHFVVVYTVRAETNRLISAWRAGRHDRKRYEDLFGS